MKKTIIHNMRQEYLFPAFDGEHLRDNPLELFNDWFEDAKKYDDEANAMTLATVSKSGMPSARILLLKEISAGGFVFFGNDNSRKMKELAENPQAAILFYWEKQKRQVRINGSCHKISDDESQAYFDTRPYGSQIAAWASNQSAVIKNRSILEKEVAIWMSKYSEGQVPKPPYWGGWRLTPNEIEFWQGRINRLHDRFVYQRINDRWTSERLYP